MFTISVDRSSHPFSTFAHFVFHSDETEIAIFFLNFHIFAKEIKLQK